MLRGKMSFGLSMKIILMFETTVGAQSHIIMPDRITNGPNIDGMLIQAIS
jgi:hypothetical protein